jgi:hypothetical protein
MCVRSPFILPLAFKRPASKGARVKVEVTVPPPHGPILLDMTMIHPRCQTYIAPSASQATGPNVALHDRSEFRAHVGHLHPGHTFVPACMVT